ncbi:hypothetical protein AGABI1DRAFT_108204 [Agaricus bisporus var. burnettii JB137-S8]|uniref:Uncharacterized protein n=1 Tax=Agaricus bisporus var. burnettii (strain JB137-S8 / ATCC MYA-4627 / FGSC 10392) TaxID=597362 RepID=K5X2I2_AGABU|nr:uncharacterized protein AGABI1DRAFT_108204 [Agaricus bisporus var. burnettii JB137-S8]EKM77368.1 hypothetical protein AGABI1DRAFT_108204 [Agaricus bisporus var. burnettii JB137-S8]
MALTGPSSEWAYAFGVDLPAGTKRGADIHLVSGLRLDKLYQACRRFYVERVEYNSLGIFAGDGRASSYAPKIPTVRIKAEQWSGGWHEIIKSGSGALSESECNFQPPLNY